MPAGRSSPRGSSRGLRLRPVCLQYGTGALGRGRGRPRRRRGWRASCPCSPGTATVADPSPGRRTRHRGTQRPPPAVSAGRCRRRPFISWRPARLPALAFASFSRSPSVYSLDSVPPTFAAKPLQPIDAIASRRWIETNSFSLNSRGFGVKARPSYPRISIDRLVPKPAKRR